MIMIPVYSRVFKKYYFLNKYKFSVDIMNNVKSVAESCNDEWVKKLKKYQDDGDYSHEDIFVLYGTECISNKNVPICTSLQKNDLMLLVFYLKGISLDFDEKIKNAEEQTLSSAGNVDKKDVLKTTESYLIEF